MFLLLELLVYLLIPYSLFYFNSCLSDTFVIDYSIHYECCGMFHVVEAFDSYSYSIFVSKC